MPDGVIAARKEYLLSAVHNSSAVGQGEDDGSLAVYYCREVGGNLLHAQYRQKLLFALAAQVFILQGGYFLGCVFCLDF